MSERPNVQRRSPCCRALVSWEKVVKTHAEMARCTACGKPVNRWLVVQGRRVIGHGTAEESRLTP